VRREHHSHEESRYRQHGQHEAHVLKERVKELERDVVQLIVERDEALAQRDRARDSARRSEEIIAILSGAEHGTVFVDVD
jgi:cytochrome c-type biogenesis protein CcmH/NrfG